MSMRLDFGGANPLRALWDPQLTFTGTSVMTINPATGGGSAVCARVFEGGLGWGVRVARGDDGTASSEERVVGGLGWGKVCMGQGY